MDGFNLAWPGARRLVLWGAGGLAALLVAGLLLAVGFVAYQTRPDPLDVRRYPQTSADYRLPVAAPNGPRVEMSRIITGHHDGPEALIFRGGRLGVTHRTVFSGVLVRHPKATFLFEGGVGSRINGEFERNFHGWQKQLFGGNVFHKPLSSQLQDAKVDPDQIAFLLLTHLHWDHAGVIRDFPGKPVLVTREEHDGMLNSPAGVGTFKEQFDDPAIKWNFVAFTDGPFGPFPQSRDLFGDKSVVLVPLAGHTPGGLGMFVTLASGERYFFIGDVAWATQGVRIPSERIPLAEGLADKDAASIRRELVFLHRLWIANPTLKIVPAHDNEAFRSIPDLAPIAAPAP